MMFPGLAPDAGGLGLSEKAETSDRRFTVGKGGVLSVGATGDGKVEFVELADHIGPKVKNVKIEARPAEEIYITEDMVTVISTKIPKKRRKAKRSREHFRPDQFDRLLEKRMEDKMRRLDDLQQKMEDVDKLMQDPMRRIPLPR